jgi:hypothetical protein
VGDRQAPGYIKEWQGNGIKWVFKKHRYFFFFFLDSLKLEDEISRTANPKTQLLTSQKLNT